MIEWLTVKDVAESLNVSERSVRNYIKKRKLKSTKTGKYHKIKKTDLDDFIEKSKAMTGTDALIKAMAIATGSEESEMRGIIDMLIRMNKK